MHLIVQVNRAALCSCHVVQKLLAHHVCHLCWQVEACNRCHDMTMLASDHAADICMQTAAIAKCLSVCIPNLQDSI
jgi:hypothetical protein